MPPKPNKTNASSTSARAQALRAPAFAPLAAALLVLVALPSLTAASRVMVLDPVNKDLRGPEPEVLDLGVVGPGQKIEIVAARGAGEVSKIRPPNEAVWDKLVVVKEKLPLGWLGVDSLLYEEPMKAFVIVDKNAPDGKYIFEATAVDTFEGMTPLTFKAKVRVTRDVLDAEVSKTVLRAGAGQPAVYLLTLSNMGSANDVFKISVEEGLPKAWRYTKDVFVPHNTRAAARYEVVSEEQGEFQITFRAESLSSPAIVVRRKAVLVTEATLSEDMKAAAHGILLFPSIAQVVYALLGFLANLFP